MKKTVLLFLSILTVLLPTPLPAEELTGRALLERVDENLTSESRIVLSRMVIHDRRGTRTVRSRTWARGQEDAFTEYLSPPRERGTKMLKLENRLWIYSPSTDRTILIAGHLLRQSVMGSDLSYEDMMEEPRLSDIYEATVTGTEILAERSCRVLELKALRSDINYPSRRLWVDRERFVPLREELYAKSGKLLKTVTLSDFDEIGDRWYPKRIVYKDVLKTGDGTEFLVESIEFDIPIPDHVFSKASLRR